MIGFNVSEAGHVVNILPPVDITGGATIQAFSMKNYDHASILVQLGVTAAAPTSIILNACTDASGSNPTAIPFSYYAQTTAGTSHDVLGSRTTVAATGITSVTANDKVFYVIEIDSAELPDGSPYLLLAIAAPGSSILASAVAILSAGRHQFAGSPTVTA